jgi:hypothetical protein
MHGASDRRDEGNEGVDEPDRAPSGTLNRLTRGEAYALAVILLAATALGDLSLYVKLDAFQRATVGLVQTQNKNSAEILTQVLKEVKTGQNKTDMVAQQAIEIAKQTEDLSRQATELGRQNTIMLTELKVITTQHTRDIKAAKIQAEEANVSARKARATSVQTQKTITTPWWKRH